MPNWSESLATIDFITALGRVLRDGVLRDAFVSDPLALARRIGLRECDQPLFLQLDPVDLEFQARVLLRKRFDSVRPALPRTCGQLGAQARSEFHGYARLRWPAPENQVPEDVFGFCQHLHRSRPGSVCPLGWNRARFACGRRRFAVHWVKAMPFRGRPGVQLLLRFRSGQRHEWQVWFDGF